MLDDLKSSFADCRYIFNWCVVVFDHLRYHAHASIGS